MNNIDKIRNGRVFEIGDIFIAAVIIIAIFISVFLFLQPEGETVNIYSGGRPVGTFPLKADTEITVNYGNSKNTVVICEGKVSVTGSGCPDHTCEFSGPISKIHSKIICVPNKLVVEISGASDVEVTT